jgi:hypothetical protein
MAFRNSPPPYHPLPRHLPLPRLRNTAAFKALDLMLNSWRYVNIDPSPPLKPATRPTWQIVVKRLLQFQFYLIIYDIFTYPALRLAPKTFGSPWTVGGDYQAWIRDLSQEWGVPIWIVKGFWTICIGATNCYGLLVPWYLFAAIGIGTGVHLPEEWPDADIHPIMACSVNEFWGVRAHQMHRVRLP